MRSSAAEALVAPRAKQATPPASSGESAGPVGGQPPTHTGRVPTQLSSKSSPNSSSRNHHSKKTPISSKATSVAVPVIQSKTPTKTASTTPSKTPTTPKTLKRSGSTEGHKHTSSSGTKHPQPANFGEYDEPDEWGVNVGHLIIDLDADIAQADKGKVAPQPTTMNANEEKPNLKMKIKRTKPSSKTSEAKHVIVKSEAPATPSSAATPVLHNTTSHHNGSGTKSIDATSPRTPILPRGTYKKEKRRLEVNGSSSPTRSKTPPNGPLTPEKESRSRSDSQSSEPPNQSASTPSSKIDGPPPKKQKMVETKDVCVGTSVGTMTEPDSLGPCEPGTHVMLEGIVWHETDAGVLVVNVTWRGKTYVGSLIDCTKHDWAPPRLSDTPNVEDTKTPKGRGKRGRAAAGTSTPGPELNVTETRSGKLRNASKGRRGSPFLNSTGESSAKNDSLKRKFGKDHETPHDTKSHKKPKISANKSSNESSSPDPATTPDTIDQVDTPIATPPQPPESPKMIPCDVPTCGKKFTQLKALQFHQTDAHKSLSNETNKENFTPNDTGHVPMDTSPPREETPKNSPIREASMNNNQPGMVGLNDTANDRVHTTDNKVPDLGTVHELKRSIGMSHLPGSPLPNRTPMPFGHVPRSPPGSPNLGDTKIEDEKKTVLVGPGGRPPLTQIDNPASQNTLVSPGVPQGTPLSELPGTPNQELVKDPSVPAKEADAVDIGTREDARSPAYSDISDANDSTPMIDTSLDPKDDKKMELPLGGYNANSYPIYYAGYGHPPHPYMMSSLPPNSPTMLKPDLIDKGLDKSKKDGLQSPTDYMNRNQQMMYNYGMYSTGFSTPYCSDAVLKEFYEKTKQEAKDTEDAGDKGPTDLSKNALQPNGSEKSKDERSKTESVSVPKDAQERAHHLPEKRSLDPLLALRYPGLPYDARMPVISPSNDKPTDARHASLGKPPTPVPLTSPRPGPTPPNSHKEEKVEKRPDSAKSEGVKPTMETTGPPPPPTSSNYFSQFPYPPVAFDPYRASMMPAMSLPSGFPAPYIPSHPSMGQLRFPLGVPNGPEDLSRGGSSNMLGASALYPHKLAELQERAQKSPIPPVSMMQSPYMRNSSPVAYSSKEVSYHPSMHPSSSPSMSTASSVPSTTFSSPLHIPMTAASALDRKGAPYPPLPEALPYSLMSAPFGPHFPGKG